MALKGSKAVFSTNSVTNKMLQESLLNSVIETGKLIVFHAEENTSTGKSVNVYFVQKVADATSTDGLDMGIIANTATRGNNAKYVRSVRSFTNNINGKNQNVIVDFQTQALALELAGETPFTANTPSFGLRTGDTPIVFVMSKPTVRTCIIAYLFKSNENGVSPTNSSANACV